MKRKRERAAWRSCRRGVEHGSNEIIVSLIWHRKSIEVNACWLGALNRGAQLLNPKSLGIQYEYVKISRIKGDARKHLRGMGDCGGALGRAVAGRLRQKWQLLAAPAERRGVIVSCWRRSAQAYGAEIEHCFVP